MFYENYLRYIVYKIYSLFGLMYLKAFSDIFHTVHLLFVEKILFSEHSSIHKLLFVFLVQNKSHKLQNKVYFKQTNKQ